MRSQYPANTTHKNVILARARPWRMAKCSRRLCNFARLVDSVEINGHVCEFTSLRGQPQHPPPHTLGRRKFLPRYLCFCLWGAKSPALKYGYVNFGERMATLDESPVHGPGRPEWRTCWRHICAVRAALNYISICVCKARLLQTEESPHAAWTRNKMETHERKLVCGQILRRKS